MSSPTASTSTSIATVWPQASNDKFGRKSYVLPYLVACCFDANDGTAYTSNRGVQFTPSAVVWLELNQDLHGFREGDHIAKGDHTAHLDPSSVNTALPIKDVQITDCSLLGEDDDVRILA